MEQLDGINAWLDGIESWLSQPCCNPTAGALGKSSKSNNNAENQENQLENRQENPPQRYDLRTNFVKWSRQNPNLEWAREFLERAHREAYDMAGDIAKKKLGWRL